MNETLKNIIIGDLQKLIDDSRLDGCGCTIGDYQNPPEQCDACWSRLELDDLREWKSDAEHQLDQCNVCWKFGAGAAHYIPEWFLIYARDMASHQLTDENLIVLFIYHILPILSEELK